MESIIKATVLYNDGIERVKDVNSNLLSLVYLLPNIKHYASPKCTGNMDVKLIHTDTTLESITCLDLLSTFEHAVSFPRSIGIAFQEILRDSISKKTQSKLQNIDFTINHNIKTGFSNISFANMDLVLPFIKTMTVIFAHPANLFAAMQVCCLLMKI